jgi:aspartate-semialdehyde dehydrogenase
MPGKQGAAGLDVAVVGAGTLMGEELRGILAECNFPIAEAVMMGEGEQVGKLMEFNGMACLVTELDAKRLERMDLLFVCDRGPGARRAVSAARRGKGFVIDLMDAEGSVADPVVNMQVNASDLPPKAPARVRVPHQAVQALSTALGALSGKSRIREVRATAITPVSEQGKPAVEELIQQTTGVLTFGAKPQKVLSRQVAFNVIPHALMHVQQGWPDLDTRLSAELAGVLGLQAADVTMRALLAPVFHGIGVLATVALDPLPPAARRRKLLGRSPLKYGPVTPADLDESQAVHVVDLGEEADGRLGLWVVCDNLRGGSAVNGVAIAETLAGQLRGHS